MNELSCALTLSHLFVNEVGELRVCCVSDTSASPLSDSEGAILANQPNAFARAFKALNEHRKIFKSQSWPKECITCRDQEARGAYSHRQSMNHVYSGLFDAEEPRLISLDLRLGNQCNLACRMCHPMASRALIPAWEKFYPHQDWQKYKSLDWHQNPQFIENLNSVAGGLRFIHFGGGEPFLIPNMRDILKSLIESGHSRKIVLTYNTNFTKWGEDLRDLWREFAGVKLMVSMDGWGVVNDYIRHPSKWDRVYAGLQQLEENMSEWNVINATINLTAQVYNIFDLGEMFQKLTSEFRQINPWPQVSILHEPRALNVRVLSREQKVEVTKDLEKWIVLSPEAAPEGWRGPALEAFQSQLNSLLEYMNAHDDSHLANEFWRMTRVYDHARGQDYTATFPKSHWVGHSRLD